MNRVQYPSSAAFTLVEVTLALLVVAVGIFSLFALFPFGLQQGAKATFDTRAALFADETFAALSAQAEENWDSVGINVPTAAEDQWVAPSNLVVGSVTPKVYQHQVGATSVVDSAFRYRLTIRDITGNVKGATLELWDGEFGGLTNPAVFYTEMFKWKP